MEKLIWFKAFHVVFLVTWFAGLFYLPRLFVYHADAGDAPSIERFKIMERRLYLLMTIGGVLTAVFGFAQILLVPGFLSLPWMHIKLTLVALLIAYHAWCYLLVRDFAADANRHSSKWYRMFNEAPTLLLISIVLLAVVKRPV